MAFSEDWSFLRFPGNSIQEAECKRVKIKSMLKQESTLLGAKVDNWKPFWCTELSSSPSNMSNMSGTVKGCNWKRARVALGFISEVEQWQRTSFQNKQPFQETKGEGTLPVSTIFAMIGNCCRTEFNFTYFNILHTEKST